MYKVPKTKSNMFSYNFCLLDDLLIWCPESEVVKNLIKCNFESCTPWGSGGWPSWFPGRRRWRWRSCGGQRWVPCWPAPSPPPPQPLQLARSPENLVGMSIRFRDAAGVILLWKATKIDCVCVCVHKLWKHVFGRKCQLHRSKVNHWCAG